MDGDSPNKIFPAAIVSTYHGESGQHLDFCKLGFPSNRHSRAADVAHVEGGEKSKKKGQDMREGVNMPSIGLAAGAHIVQAPVLPPAPAPRESGRERERERERETQRERERERERARESKRERATCADPLPCLRHSTRVKRDLVLVSKVT